MKVLEEKMDDSNRYQDIYVGAAILRMPKLVGDSDEILPVVELRGYVWKSEYKRLGNSGQKSYAKKTNNKPDTNIEINHGKLLPMSDFTNESFADSGTWDYEF